MSDRAGLGEIFSKREAELVGSLLRLGHSRDEALQLAVSAQWDAALALSVATRPESKQPETGTRGTTGARPGGGNSSSAESSRAARRHDRPMPPRCESTGCERFKNRTTRYCCTHCSRGETGIKGHTPQCESRLVRVWDALAEPAAPGAGRLTRSGTATRSRVAADSQPEGEPGEPR